MTKSELIECISVWNKIPKKTVATVIDDFLEEIKTSLIEGGKVQLSGFGTFSVRKRAARTGRNPRTNEPIQLPASKLPCFKAGKSLKDAVNQ